MKKDLSKEVPSGGRMLALYAIREFSIIEYQDEDQQIKYYPFVNGRKLSIIYNDFDSALMGAMIHKQVKNPNEARSAERFIGKMLKP